MYWTASALSKYKQRIDHLTLKGKAFDGNVQWKYILKSKFGSNGERHLDQRYLVGDKFAAMECIRKKKQNRRPLDAVKNKKV